jgi:hypothetical protein
MPRLKQLLILTMAFASARAFGSQDPSPLPNDTAPIDWSGYQTLWIKGLPRATDAEPMLDHVDEKLAIAFLDDTSLRWIRQNKCATCHTSVPYLMVRSLLQGGDAAAMQEIRKTVKAFAATQEKQHRPIANFLVAAAASALAVNDARMGGGLDPDVRKMFDYLWTTQDADGGWRYPLNGMLPFLERSRYYVSLLVALGVGYAPGHYFDTPSAQAGIVKLHSFLRKNIPENVHDRTVLLWASVRTPGLLLPSEQVQYKEALLRLQNADGGWTLPALDRLPRHDGAPNDPQGPSDGYATGLATMVLCETGYSVRDPWIQKAISWLETHQRSSGRWFTRSTYSDGFQNYLSNMATAYALMALKSCTPPVTNGPMREDN